jgi:hypothetical protein
LSHSQIKRLLFLVRRFVLLTNLHAHPRRRLLLLIARFLTFPALEARSVIHLQIMSALLAITAAEGSRCTAKKQDADKNP